MVGPKKLNPRFFSLQIEALEIRKIPLNPSRLWELVEEVKGNRITQ